MGENVSHQEKTVLDSMIEVLRLIRDEHPPKTNLNPTYHALSSAISQINRVKE